jgi:hypothetical protein
MILQTSENRGTFDFEIKTIKKSFSIMLLQFQERVLFLFPVQIFITFHSSDSLHSIHYMT